MSALLQLTRFNALSLERTRYQAQSRVDLASGKAIGMSIRLPFGMPAETALELACTLAQDAGSLVSLAAIAPFSALPRLAAVALARCDVPPEHLEFTVTDRSLDDAGTEALLSLSELRDQGIGVALRGFGRGKIAIEPRLPLNSVILSASILQDIPGNAAATMLLHSLNGLARSQSVNVVATGVATEAQRAILSGINCHAGEGSLFGTSLLSCRASNLHHPDSP